MINETDSPLARRVREAGFKLTPSRLAVLQVFEQGCDHLNATEIYEHAQAIRPSIGLATIYRALELFTDLGIVRPITVGDGPPTYIRAEGGHHHLVCSKCGTVIEFDECSSGSLAVELAARYDFHIQSHLLEFYGLCADCHTPA
jgi:Fur family ferric uptake transcriptional regulator